MNRTITTCRAIQYVTAFAAILLILGVWPLGLIQRGYVTGADITPNAVTESAGIARSEPSSFEHMEAQVFASDGTELKSVDIYVCDDVSGQMLDFAIYDGEFNRFFHKEFYTDEDTVYPGFIHIPVRTKLERGIPYIFTLTSEEGVVIGMEDHYTASNPSMYAANYDGMEDPDRNVYARMDYGIALSLWQIIAADLVIAATAVLLIFITGRITASLPRLHDSSVTVLNLIRIVADPVIVILSLISLYTIYPRCYFSDKTYNIVFGYISVLMFAGLLLYYINYKRPYETVQADDRNSDSGPSPAGRDVFIGRIRGYLTAIAISAALWYCGEYMNGLFDIVHSYNARRILIWLLIAVITTYSRKEIVNVYNLIWAAAGIPIGYFYARPYTGMQEEELLYRLNAWIIYIGGFVALNMFITLIKAVMRRAGRANGQDNDSSVQSDRPGFRLIYLIPFVIFSAGLVILSNTRWWPAYLLTVLAVIGFRLFFLTDRDKWSEYLCNGIILNFMAMVIFSLLHRPYHAYRYYRYNMNYFTVTMTATHLTLSMAAITVRYYIRKHKVKDRRELLPDLMLFGTVTCYILFTISRTAYVAVAVMMLTALILGSLTYRKMRDRPASVGRDILILLIAVIYMFPPVFSATCLIPAAVDEPVIYAYEPLEATLYEGTEPDDEKRMDIHRFISVFGSRMFHVGDTITGADIDPDILEFRIGEVYELASAGTGDDTYVILEPLWQVASADGDALGDADIPLSDGEDADTDSEDTYEEDEEEEDASNGRMDIFRCYIEQSNLWGHDEMGAILDDGEEASHAHNIYLQVIYDHGLIFGIYYILFMIFTWILSVIMTARQAGRGSHDYSLLLPVVLTGFMVAGLVEWIFHPCNPFGLAVCLAMLPMLFTDRSREAER